MALFIHPTADGRDGHGNGTIYTARRRTLLPCEARIRTEPLEFHREIPDSQEDPEEQVTDDEDRDTAPAKLSPLPDDIRVDSGNPEPSLTHLKVEPASLDILEAASE
ncbi:hypothetical protein MMC12_004126 [Toensbergia leucococca]|nr:hypothetical protein [Toensbergia leucococca]